jgi:nicotinamide-nucleotide amidase
MLNDFVLLQIRSQLPERCLVQRAFHFAGIPESVLDEEIRPLVKRTAGTAGSKITHGILASQSVVTVKFSVEADNWDDTRGAADKLEKKFLTVFRNRFFGRDKETLPYVLGRWFLRQHKTLAVAESCTGGLISKLITDESGSSSYFIEGLATYSNRSKMKRLNIKASTLQRYGAVSREVARDMARNLRLLTNVDYALSVTGIAGPTGGSLEKPVGLVYVGCATPRHVVVDRFHFSGDRAVIRQRAAMMALEMLRRHLPN